MFNLWPFRGWPFFGKEKSYTRFYTLAGDVVHRFCFKVKAKQEAVMKLYPENGTRKANKPAFVITLGDYNNTSSSITTGKLFNSRHTEGILSSTEYRGFWITVVRGSVSIGRLGNTKPFITLHDTGQADVEYWYFEASSREEACCQWIYPEQSFNPRVYGRVGQNEYLDFFPISMNHYGKIEMIFRAQSENIAGISFLKVPITGPGYEIIFGNFEGSSCKLYVHGKLEMQSNYGTLSPTSCVDYLITIYQGSLTIGFPSTLRTRPPFLRYEDPYPFCVGCYSLMATTVPVRYECDFLQDTGFESYKKLSCKGYVNFSSLPVNTDGSIEFEFTLSSCDVSKILMQEMPDPLYRDGYELEFTNNSLAFYRNRVLKNVVAISKEHYKEHERYCITIEGTVFEISYRYGALKHPIFSFVDQHPVPVKWFSFYPCNCRSCTKKTCFCESSYKFNFTGVFGQLRLMQSCTVIPPIPKKLTKLHECVIYVRVRTANDAHILLSEIKNPGDEVPVYEIVLGGDSNTVSYLCRMQGGTRIATADTPDIVSDEQLRGFWIVFSNGVLSVGASGKGGPFLVWFDTHPLFINFLSYSLKELSSESDNKERKSRFAINMPSHVPGNIKRKSSIHDLSGISRRPTWPALPYSQDASRLSHDSLTSYISLSQGTIKPSQGSKRENIYSEKWNYKNSNVSKCTISSNWEQFFGPNNDKPRRRSSARNSHYTGNMPQEPTCKCVEKISSVVPVTNPCDQNRNADRSTHEENVSA